MKKALIAVLCLGVLLLATGCVKSFKQIFVEMCAAAGYTVRQQEAAYDKVLKGLFMIKLGPCDQCGGTGQTVNETGEEIECPVCEGSGIVEDEEGEYVINTASISVEDVYKVAGEILDDLDLVLDPDRSTWYTFMDALPTLREGFEREEQRWTYIQSQLGQVKLYFDFRKLLGDRVSDEDREYKIEYLWPDNFDADFSVAYIERARKDGGLREVERQFSYLYTPYGTKERNPDNPTDANDFVWEPKLQGYLVVSYRVLNDKVPEELSADYVEVFRAEMVEADAPGLGVAIESKPCVRAFRKSSGTRLNVMIIDYDGEGESGFGVIDDVRSVSSDVGSKLFTAQSALFGELATSRGARADQRRVVEPPVLEIQIVRVGEVDQWRGDYNEAGWMVPDDYKDEYEIDWRTAVSFVDQPNGYPFKVIEYIRKIWNSQTVWEQWLPAEPFQGEMETVTVTGRNILYQLRNGSPATVSASELCGVLESIIYKDGNEWVKIADLDGTGILQYRVRNVPNPAG